ncbi:hypothetical protein ABIB40_001643 [Pedobacter sp. UYP30]|uniref:6-bladed beta-propeller n=1 Tax=Pedobacter sp. UYP30 TaxID=1756400 RepID=UPI0033930B46
MKTNKITRCIFLSIFLFPLFSIAQVGKIDSSEMVTIRLDPQSARGATVSQIFDEVKFVPLETTKESLFGQIGQFKLVNNSYLIYDYDTKALLIFNTEGKFLVKIDATKLQSSKDDKEKAQFYGFTSDKIDGKDFIVIYTPNNVQYFDFKGNYIKKVSNKDFKFNNNIKFKDGDTEVKTRQWVKDGKDSTFYKLMLYHPKTKDSVAYFVDDENKYDKDDWYGDEGFTKYADNAGFFVNFYDYNLYKVTPNKVSLAYNFIFPALNTITKDFITNPLYIKKRQDYFDKNRKVFYGLGNCYLMGENLFLKLSTGYWNKDQKKSLIYNVKTAELTSFQDIEPDSLSSFLPITDSGFSYEFEGRGFSAFEDGKFYTSYSSLAAFTFKERIADKKVNYPPLLANYFKTGDRKSNPILIILTPKKN